MSVFELSHKGMGIMRCDVADLEPDEIAGLKALGRVTSFSFSRVVPDKLPSLGSDYSMMDMIRQEQAASDARQMHKRAMNSRERY